MRDGAVRAIVMIASGGMEDCRHGLLSGFFVWVLVAAFVPSGR